jgi:hypothetical protein
MPLPTSSLTKSSSKESVQDAISGCISMLSDEHPEWEHDRVVAACISDAVKHAGRKHIPERK